MSKKKTEINPIRAERVKTIIEREGLTQAAFAGMIFQTQQNVSRIIQMKQPLTEATARDIIEKFPGYRLPWLLGYDDFMTMEDFSRDYVGFTQATNDAAIQILDAALREVCAREGMDVPDLNNIPELWFLQAQLRDFADGLMWNYVKHREHSHVWSFLDQIGDKK